MKTSELTGIALNWAVAQCEGESYVHAETDYAIDGRTFQRGTAQRAGPYYSTNWAQGGPIIEREGISINAHLDGNEWFARDYWGLNEHAAEKPLEAAMRCYVASKLGDTVEIPEEIQNAN